MSEPRERPMTSSDVDALLRELRDSPVYSPARLLRALATLAKRDGLRFVTRCALAARPPHIHSCTADVPSAVVSAMLGSDTTRLPFSACMLAATHTTPVYLADWRRYNFEPYTIRRVGTRIRVSCETHAQLAQLLVTMIHVNYCYLRTFDGESLPTGVPSFRVAASVLLPPPRIEPNLGAAPAATGSQGASTGELEPVPRLFTRMSVAELVGNESARFRAPPCMAAELGAVASGVVPKTHLVRLRVSAIWKRTGLAPRMLLDPIRRTANKGREDTIPDFRAVFGTKDVHYGCASMRRANLCPFKEPTDIENARACAGQCGVAAPLHTHDWAPSIAIRAVVEQYNAAGSVAIEYEREED